MPRVFGVRTRRRSALDWTRRIGPRIGIGAVVIGPVAVGGLRRRPIPRGRRARPPCALVLLAYRFGCFLPRCLSLGGIGRSRDGGFLSISLPGRRFPRGGLAGRGLPRDGPSRPRGPRRRLRLLPRRAGRRLCLLGLLLGRLGLALLRRGVLLRRGCGFGLFPGAAAAGPGSSVFGLGVVVAGIIIGVAGLSGSAGRGGGIGAVATGSSAAPDGAVPSSIAAKTAGKKIRTT